MPFANEHACRIQPPEQFDSKTFRTSRDKFGTGIHAIFGKKKGSDDMELQTIRFDASKFSASEAKEKAKSLGQTCILFEKAKDENARDEHARDEHANLETRNMDNEEIFAAGEWTSSNKKVRNYKKKDLEIMARCASELGDNLKIPIKLGHDGKQKALFADGLPAAGWVENLRVSGDKLVADLKRVPKKIFELIKAGAYATKSLEIWHDFKCEATGKEFKHAPVGLALLGAELPAVPNLNSLMQLYSSDRVPNANVSFYFKPQDGGVTMSIEEAMAKIDELQAKIAELEAKLQAKSPDDNQAPEEKPDEKKPDENQEPAPEAAPAAEKVAEAKDIAQEIKVAVEEALVPLKEEITEKAAEITELKKAREKVVERERNAFLDKHSAKFIPAQRDMYMRMLEDAEKVPDSYSHNAEDGKKLTGEDAARAIIEALPESKMLDEYGRAGDGELTGSSHQKRTAKIESYCKEKKLDFKSQDGYRTAVNALIKDGKIKIED